MIAVVRILSVDLETTGLKVDKDRIVQYSAILFDDAFAEQGRWGGLVNPGIPIPAEATEVHGFRDADVATAPPFVSLAPMLRELVTPDTILAGFNAHRYDVPLLHYEFLRSGLKGIPVTQPVIDTYRIEQEVNRHSLEDTYHRYHGTPIAGAHNAEVDNLAHIAILRRQRDVHGHRLPKTLPELAITGSENAMDWGGYFVKDADGKVRFGFGKHEGDLAASHLDYLDWMVRSDFPADVKAIARQLMLPALRR